MFTHMNNEGDSYWYQVGVQHVQTAGEQTDDDHDPDFLIGSYINRENYPILENTSLQKQDLTIW